MMVVKKPSAKSEQRIHQFKENFQQLKKKLIFYHWQSISKSNYIISNDMSSITQLTRKIVINNPPGTRNSVQLKQITTWLLITENKRTRHPQNIFNKLSPDDLSQICQYISIQLYSADELIFLQHEQSSGLYFILTGEIGVYDAPVSKIDQVLHQEFLKHRISTEMNQYPKQPIEDKEHPSREIASIVSKFNCIGIQGLGDCFGEVSLLSASAITTASVITRKATELLVLNRSVYEKIVKPMCRNVYIYDTVLEFLRKHEMFVEFLPSQIPCMAYWVEERHYDRGSVLLSNNSRNFQLMFIFEGEVKLCCVGRDNKNIDLSILGSGGVLGESSSFNDKLYPNFDVISQTDLTVFTFSESNYKKFLKFVSNSNFLQLLKTLYYEREEFISDRIEKVEDMRTQANTKSLQKTQLQTLLGPNFIPTAPIESPIVQEKEFQKSKNLSKSNTVNTTHRILTPSSSYMKTFRKPKVDRSIKGKYWKTSDSLRKHPNVLPSTNILNIINNESPRIECKEETYSKILNHLNRDCTMKELSVLWSPSKTRNFKPKTK